MIEITRNQEWAKIYISIGVLNVGPKPVLSVHSFYTSLIGAMELDLFPEVPVCEAEGPVAT